MSKLAGTPRSHRMNALPMVMSLLTIAGGIFVPWLRTPACARRWRYGWTQRTARSAPIRRSNLPSNSAPSTNGADVVSQTLRAGSLPSWRRLASETVTRRIRPRRRSNEMREVSSRALTPVIGACLPRGRFARCGGPFQGERFLPGGRLLLGRRLPFCTLLSSDSMTSLRNLTSRLRCARSLALHLSVSARLCATLNLRPVIDVV